MKETDQLLDSLVMEMRRGMVILGVLSRLSISQYGYSLIKTLEKEGFNVEPGTLYPLLRRLEKQGLLESSWDTSENRPRKYYLLSAKGIVVYEQLRDEWHKLAKSIATLIDHEMG